MRLWEQLALRFVFLKGGTDTDADAPRVARLLANLRCKGNLIAADPGPGHDFETLIRRGGTFSRTSYADGSHVSCASRAGATFSPPAVS